MGEMIVLDIPTELGGGEIRTIVHEGRRYYSFIDVVKKLSVFTKAQAYISLIQKVLPKLNQSRYLRNFDGDEHIQASHEITSKDWRDKDGNRKYIPWGGVQVCIYEASCPEARKLAEWLENVCEKVIEGGVFDPKEEERRQALKEEQDPILYILDMQRKTATDMLDLAIRQKRTEHTVEKLEAHTHTTRLCAAMALSEAQDASTKAENARSDAQDARMQAAIANECVEYLKQDIKELANIATHHHKGYSLTTQYIHRNNLCYDESELGMAAAQLAKKLGGTKTNEGWRGPNGEVLSYYVPGEGTRYSQLNRWHDDFLNQVVKELNDPVARLGSHGELFD